MNNGNSSHTYFEVCVQRTHLCNSMAIISLHLLRIFNCTFFLAQKPNPEHLVLNSCVLGKHCLDVVSFLQEKTSNHSNFYFCFCIH